LATGAGFSIRYRKTSQVTVAFFGDGASNQGTFHESLNMAGLWQLPVIYVCENNFYAMSTPLCASTANNGDIAARGKAYGIESHRIDGNDILTVKSTVRQAVERARKGGGPVLIEMVTYRHKGHSKSDQCFYRSKEEENRWLEKCPLKNTEKLILEKNLLSQEQLENIKAEAKSNITKAVEFAVNSPLPELGEMQ
jgi:pyruvate dehydrogenase E1 component alpha subunit